MMREFAAPSPSVGFSATMTRMDRSVKPRAAHRFKIFQPGRWSAAGTTVPIHLLDISTSGALAYAKAPPRLGDYVLIECGLLLGKARVTWRDGNKFGVCFVVSLGSETLDAVAGTLTQRSDGSVDRVNRDGKFLSLKELHRLPSPPQGQTSVRTRYLTDNTTAAQRLRALGACRRTALTAATGSFRADRTFAGDEVNDVIWSIHAIPERVPSV